MADLFDATAAGQEFTTLVSATSGAIKDAAGDTTPRPIFTLTHDGSVVDRKGQLVRGPITPLDASVK